MTFEGIICPACSGSLDEELLSKKLQCQHCGVKFKQKKYLAFMEYLISNGIVDNLDFFDKSLYGDEVEIKTIEEQELSDETNPDDYEAKVDRMKFAEDNPGVENTEITTKEEEFRKWDGIDEDWMEFNQKDEKKSDK